MRYLTRLFKILFVRFLIRGIFRVSKTCVQVKIPRNFFKEAGCLVFYLPASEEKSPCQFRSVPCEERAAHGPGPPLSVLAAARRGKLPASRSSGRYAITVS